MTTETPGAGCGVPMSDEERARDLSVKVYALMPEDAGNVASGMISAALADARQEERHRVVAWLRRQAGLAGLYGARELRRAIRDLEEGRHAHATEPHS